MTFAVEPAARAVGRIDEAAPEAPGLRPGRLAGAATGRKQAYAREARALFIAMMRLADVLVVVITAVASYTLAKHEPDLPVSYWLIVGLATLLNVNIFSIAGVYEFSNLLPPRNQLVRVLIGWATTLLLSITVLYLAKLANDFSRAWMIMWAISGGWAFVLARFGFWRWMRRRRADGALALRVVVTGADRTASDVADRLRCSAGPQTEVTAIFPGDGTCETDAQCTDLLIDLTRRQRIDEVVIAWRFEVAPSLSAMLGKLGEIPIDVKIHPLAAGASHAASTAPLPVSIVLRRPLAGWDTMLKRGVDIVLSAILLLFFLPLMPVLAAVIAIDSRGPILFRQLRYGLNNEPIEIYKFRTMQHDPAPDPEVPQARRNDPRVTRVGQFLRRSSLDELPQLLNVCRGDMSLVGPRPHAVAHNEKYAKLIDAYAARHRVKPGITGWAQVNGARGETSTAAEMRRRIEYDLYYIEHWSLLLDFRILFRTLRCMMHDPRAY
jgi:Undecaprenyl-phosphate glucose phosphotransferase